MGLLQSYVYKGRELHLFSYEGVASSGNGAETGQRQGSTPASARLGFDALRVEPEGDSLKLSARVYGPDLAYLYTELLLKDPVEDRYYGPLAREYVRADRNDGSSGITRPDWDEPVHLSVRVRPLLRLATDGADFAFCFALPEAYTSPGYRQGGLYTSADQSEPLRALLGFTSEGALKRAIAYDEQAKVSGAKVLDPGKGDRFAPFAQVFTPSAASGGWETSSAVADALTLGSYPLRMVTEKPFPGDYLVGVLAQSLHGEVFREYVALRLAG